MPKTTSPHRSRRSREFAADVRRDLALTPKQLQSKYLYDALGSSLFEAICRLPWYRITRAESAAARAARRRHRRARCDRRRRHAIVELGCGSGEKMVILAEALQARGGRARVHLIDISSPGAGAVRAHARPPAAHLGRRPPRDLRGRPAPARRRSATATIRCSCCCSARTSATSITPAAHEFLARDPRRAARPATRCCSAPIS